jgi:cytoskeletal protein CcmA (bactofilin family)
MSLAHQSNTVRNSVFLADIVIEGEGITGEALVFGGELIGNLTVDRLVISETGNVFGDISAKFLRIAGLFEGTATADEIIVSETARITGKIVAQTLEIDPGAEIMGEIQCKSNVQPMFPRVSPVE